MSLTHDIPEDAYLVEPSIEGENPYSEKIRSLWFQTYTGVQFRPYDPTPDMVNIRDIAHSLSSQVRFTGHMEQWYSVAQHSVYVSYLVPEEHALAALLHDATEAYVGDLNSPTKWGQPDYSALEDFIWERAVAPKFGLPAKLPKEVKDADIKMLLFEKETCLKDFGHRWGFESIETPDLASIVPDWPTYERRYMLGLRGMPVMGPQDSKKYFMNRYHELKNRRG